MADEELDSAEFPDVGFDGNAAGGDGGVDGDFAPVVVVGVDWTGLDVAREGGWVGSEAGGEGPGGEEVLDVGFPGELGE